MINNSLKTRKQHVIMSIQVTGQQLKYRKVTAILQDKKVRQLLSIKQELILFRASYVSDASENDIEFLAGLLIAALNNAVSSVKV